MPWEWEVKDGTPSDEELEEMAEEIGGSWKSLGRCLKFSNAQIIAFDRDHEKYTEKAFRMLLAWKMRNGPHASYHELNDALCHDLVYRKHLAEKFCRVAAGTPANILPMGDKAQHAYDTSLEDGLPPQLSFTLPRIRDLESLSKPWNELKLPIDALLFTMNDCEFLSCYVYLKDPFCSYYKRLGYVYFGTMGEGQVTVALLKCRSADLGSPLILAKNAADVLRPKVVISVGTCDSLMREKAKLGDVVLAAKLTSYAGKEVRNDRVVPCGVMSICSRNTAHLIKHAAFGWKPPLKRLDAREITVHSDSKVLSGPELVNTGWRKEELMKQHPTATAIETEGVFYAAHDLKMEWLVVKGISNYADGTTTETAPWKEFASVMAASVVRHMLNNPIVLRDLPHYKGSIDSEVTGSAWHGWSRQLSSWAASALAGPSRVLAAGNKKVVHTKAEQQAGTSANVLPREDKAQHAYDTALEDVPPEIRARGPIAEIAFQNALQNGKVQVYRGRIMLIGQDGAGKTSLKKSLLGLPFDPQEESTVGVEIDPSKFEVDVDQVKNWQRTDEKKLGETEYKDGIARMMAVELNRDDTGQEDSSLVGQERTNSSDEQVVDEDDKETTTEKSVLHPTTGMALEKTSQEDKEHIKGPRGKSTEQSELTDLQAVIDSAAALSDDVTDRVIQYLQHLKLGDDVKAKETILTLWDFAGQHLYYASHSVFLSPRAVYILVYNLSKELSATAEPCVRQGILDVKLGNPNDETNMDCLLSWLVSIHSIQPSTGGEGVKNNPDSGVAKLPYLRPPVLIVGTNADRPFEKAKQMESRVKKSISGNTYEKHVIRPLFSVDNSRAVTDAGLCALRKKIMDVLKQEPYMGEEVPIRWFNFEKVVEALVAKKTYHMNLDQLEDVIRQVCFIQDDEELALMLNFYHDLGVIVKHGRTVVLQAQWLIDLFKKLITVRPFDEADPVCAGYWVELEKNGILRMELVDHVFDDLIQQDLDKQDILDMMELYGLVAKFCPSSTDIQLKYFVPAQLTSSPPDLSEIRPSDSDPCPLYFHFLDGFVPHGLFTQIVSRCIRWCSDHSPKGAPNLYHNGAWFFLGKQTIYDVIVFCRKQFIKIVLKQRKTDAPGSSDALAEMAAQVREFLEETLQGLSRDLPWLHHLRYELCVACPSCLGAEKKCVAHELVSCTHDDCLHLIRILPEEQMICEKRFCHETLAVCGLEKWYKNKGVKKLESSVEAGPFVTPTDLSKVRSDLHPESKLVYKMTANPRGLALIINNRTFDPQAKLLERLGSEKDVESVQQLFEGLQFEVHTKTDLTRSRILEVLDDFAQKDHSGFDCFVVWLMSHGNNEMIYGRDGEPVPIETARNYFSNARCEFLKGKPKLFFIQACRGDRKDEGVETDDPGETRRSIPDQVDFMTAHSTVPKSKSFRDRKTGSPYVRCLVKVFRENAGYQDLSEMLTEVVNRVSDLELRVPPSRKKFKLCPQLESTLRKRLFFWPGL